MKKKYYFTIYLFSVALLSACSNAENTECDLCGDAQETVTQPYRVSFKLGGSVGGTTSRAANITQTAAEKHLKSLYAVVFQDADASDDIHNGDVNKAAESDLFVEAIPVDLSNFSQDDPSSTLSFSVGDEGYYNICFVANPSGSDEEPLGGLAQKITELEPGKSTVSDFKQLVETEEPDLAKSFLMTSDFYAVATAYGNTANIGKVALTRAVARVDLLNKADGVTVQSVVFHNYGAKTSLITDSPTFQSGNIIPTKKYVIDGGLPGNSEDESGMYAEKIYTYEQYANEEDSRPSLEIIYSIPTVGKWFTHTVNFEKAGTDGQSSPQVVPLKRNNHYLVTLTNPNGQICFTLGVKDWDSGETFVTEGSDFAHGTDAAVLSKSDK